MSHRLEVVPSASGEPSVWETLRDEAERAARAEAPLASMLSTTILAHHDLGAALSFQLARKLGDQDLLAMSFREVAEEAFAAERSILDGVARDLVAVFERDPACKGYLQPFLFFKGFQALQTHRLAHWLWGQGRETLAFYLQSRSSELFQVDIHPAAKIGSGVFIDHGTGITIGETASIDDDVSMLHGVTLGGTSAIRGDRHPKIGRGVLIGAGATVIGAIRIGDYAKIAAGSVVLKPVPPGCTAAGVPARLVNCPSSGDPARTMDQTLGEGDLDYVI